MVFAHYAICVALFCNHTRNVTFCFSPLSIIRPLAAKHHNIFMAVGLWEVDSLYYFVLLVKSLELTDRSDCLCQLCEIEPVVSADIWPCFERWVLVLRLWTEDSSSKWRPATSDHSWKIGPLWQWYKKRYAAIMDGMGCLKLYTTYLKSHTSDFSEFKGAWSWVAWGCMFLSDR